jgi:hypothetical protein
MENIKQPIETSPTMADRIVKCTRVLYSTVREGLDEASLWELQNQEDSFTIPPD